MSVETASAQQRIGQLASRTAVHEAFRWLHLNEKRFRDWQLAMIRIPAPPFGEAARAAWLCEEFRRIGLTNVHIDQEGNALAELLGADAAACAENERQQAESDGRRTENERRQMGSDGCVLVSAHLDTVFPVGTDCEPLEDGERIVGPGACDNAAGVTALLALASAMVHAGMAPGRTILFAGNCGEEGEGNLRGMRHLFVSSPHRGRIAATVALDGAGTESVVAQALGSRRYRVTVHGPGGHSWADAGAPSPVLALCRAVAALGEVELPSDPRTTVNVGRIEGGTAVNSIPEGATAEVDVRSTDAAQLVRIEVALHRAVEDAVLAANACSPRERGSRAVSPLTFRIESMGERPAAVLPGDARILQAIRAVDRHLGLRTEMRVGSTDANIPLALGREAISIGAGGMGGGVHTSAEWYEPKGRELALRRILLLVMDLCGG